MESVYLSTRHSAWRAEQKESKLQKNKCILSLVTDIYLTARHKQKMWIKGRKGKEGAAWVQGIRSALRQGSLLDQGPLCHIALHQASCEMMEPKAEWALGMGSKTTARCFLIRYSPWVWGLPRNRDAVLREAGSYFARLCLIREHWKLLMGFDVVLSCLQNRSRWWGFGFSFFNHKNNLYKNTLYSKYFFFIIVFFLHSLFSVSDNSTRPHLPFIQLQTLFLPPRCERPG